MFRLPLVGLGFATLITALASAAPIDSTYIGPSYQLGDPQTNYTIPGNWLPTGVPNNSATNSYNVTIPDKDVFVDIPVTISWLTIGDGGGDAALRIIDTEAAEGSFTVEGDVTNGGALTVTNSNFIVHGSLTNFNATTRTLTGGNYDIYGADIFPGGVVPVPRFGRLRFPGADIVHNAAAIAIRGDKADITDENGLNALRNFADNTARGSFFVGAGSKFTAPGDFMNAGTVAIQEALAAPTDPPLAGQLRIPPGHKYVQTGGRTRNDGFIIGDAEIQGGVFFHNFSVSGNLRAVGGILRPISSYYGFVHGDLSIGPHGILRIRIPGGTPFGTYDQLKVGGTITLGGTLEVDYRNLDDVLKSAVFKIIDGESAVGGNFANAASGERLTTLNGKGSFVVDYDGEDVLLSRFRTIPPQAQFANISARGQVFTGDNILIAGFIITGNGPKKIIVRGIGPSLVNAGIASALSDPVLDLHDGTGALITSNNNWRDTQADQIENTGIPPDDLRESAIVVTLQPGAYTIVLHGNNDVTGTALIEVYDLATDADSKLANISARGFADANNPVIAGFIVGGDGTGPSQVVARALSFSFLWFPIVGVDPRLEIRDRNGALIGRNDDYAGDDEVIEARGLAPDAAPFDPPAAALRISLPPGQYTALLFGKDNVGGLGLVELYDLYP